MKIKRFVAKSMREAIRQTILYYQAQKYDQLGEA